MTTVETGKRAMSVLDPTSLVELMHDIEEDPSKGLLEFRVHSEWKGRTRSRTSVESCAVGGRVVHRHFTIDADEPFELFGRNTAPNPQELLLAALNACMTVAYAVGAATRGITLEKLEIETAGGIDLRGFLGLDPDAPTGYESLRYRVRVKGSGTPQDFHEIHEAVMRSSPNYFSLCRPVALDGELVVD